MKPLRSLPTEVEWSFYGTARFRRDKVLLVDVESVATRSFVGELRAADFQVITVDSGSAALTSARAAMPSLIIIEAELPSGSGFELCEKLKNDAATKHIPVIMIQSEPTEAERIRGFELGVDDFVPKAFSPREMVLRIRNSLRRAEHDLPAEIKMTLGDLAVDPIRHEVTLQNKPIYVTLIEFRLLVLFMENCGRVLDRQTLLNEVWGHTAASITRTVDTHVRRLRGRLGAWAHHLQSIRGNGYRMNVLVPSFALESVKARTNGAETPYFRPRAEHGKVRVPLHKKSRGRRSIQSSSILMGTVQG